MYIILYICLLLLNYNLNMLEDKKIKNKQDFDYSQKIAKSNKKFDFLEFIAKPCSFIIYGNYQIEQKPYYCQVCDPNRTEAICFDCLNNCHESCLIQKGKQKEEDNKEISFICGCGKRKHEIKILNDKLKPIDKTDCFFWKFDKSLKNKYNYCCNSCGKSSICSICYMKCHANCKKRIKIENTNNLLQLKGFSSQLKSNIAKIKPGDDEDEKSESEISNFYKEENEGYNSAEEQCDKIDFICTCDHSNHGNILMLNSLVHGLTSSSKFSYESIAFIWQSQVVNCLLQNNNLYDCMYSFVEDFFKKYTTESVIDLVIINLVITLTSNIANSIKYYYFHPRAHLILPYERIVYFLETLDNSKIEEYGSLISSLLVYLQNVHLKQDFQNYKLMSVEDFINSNPLQRINLRQSLVCFTIYSMHLHSRYRSKSKTKTTSKIEKNKEVQQIIELVKIVNAEEEMPTQSDNSEVTRFFIFNKLPILMTNILIKAIDIYDDKILFMKVYFVAIKIIFLILKTMLLEIDELIELIDVLEKYYYKFNLSLGIILDRYKNNQLKDSEESINIVINKVTYMTKILLLININYNDRILFIKYHDKNIIKSNIRNQKHTTYNYTSDTIKKSNFNFIHFVSSHSIKLFKMVISCPLYLSNFLLENHKGFQISSYTSLTKIISHIISLYSVTDNFYLNKLKELGNNLLLDKFVSIYENMMIIPELMKFYNICSFDKGLKSEQLKLKNKRSNKIINETEISSNNDDLVDMKPNYLMIGPNESQSIVLFKKLIYDFQKIVDLKLQLFFLYKISFKEFNKDLLEIFNNMFKTQINSVTVNKRILFDSHVDNFNNNLHFCEIIHQSQYNFTKKINFIYEIDSLANELILGAADSCLSKILMIDYKNQGYNPELINSIFQFFNLYLLTHQGTYHFLIGRNIRRIIKIFPRFPQKAIIFIHTMSKAISNFKVDITNHKRLYELLDLFSDYISTFIIKTENDLNIFSKLFSLIVDIFLRLKKNLGNKQEKAIRYKLFKSIIEKENFLENINFSDIFFEQNNQKNKEIKILIPKTKKKVKNTKYGDDEENIKEQQFEEKLYILTHSANDLVYDIGYLSERFEKDIKNNDNKIPYNSYFIDSWNNLIVDKSENNAEETLFEEKGEIEIENEENINKDESHRNLKGLKANNNPLNECQSYPDDINKILTYVKINDYMNKNPSFCRKKEIDNEVNRNINNNPSFILNANQQFYLNFLNLICEGTYFFSMKDEMFYTLMNIVDLSHIKLIFSKNIFTLQQRTIILNTLRCIYLTDIVDYSSLSKQQKYPDNTMYIVIKKDKKSSKKTELNKFLVELFDETKETIKLISNEIKYFSLFIYLHQENISEINDYLINLLLILKLVADTILLENMPNSISILFYEITKEFLKQSASIINVLSNINQYGRVEGSDLSRNQSSKENLMENKNFDVFDIKLIYKIFIEEFNKVSKEISSLNKFNFKNTLRLFENEFELNFKSVSLLKEKWNICFFNEEEKINKIECKEIKETVFISDIINDYTSIFLDVNNTTMIESLDISQHDIHINYQAIFYSFNRNIIEQYENISETDYRLFLLTITKSIYYKNELRDYFSNSIKEEGLILKTITNNIIVSINKSLVLFKHSLSCPGEYYNLLKLIQLHLLMFEHLLKGENKMIEKILFNDDFYYINDVKINIEKNNSNKLANSPNSDAGSPNVSIIKAQPKNMGSGFLGNVIKLNKMDKHEDKSNSIIASNAVSAAVSRKNSANIKKDKENTSKLSSPIKSRVSIHIKNVDKTIIKNKSEKHTFKASKILNELYNTHLFEEPLPQISLINQLSNAYLKLLKTIDLAGNDFDSELITDKLLIVLICLKSFFREYIEEANNEEYIVLINTSLSKCYNSINAILKLKINEIGKKDYRIKYSLIMKYISMDLIVALIEKGTANEYLIEILSYFKPLEIINELIIIFKENLKKTKTEEGLKTTNFVLTEQFIPKLIEKYRFDKSFNSSLELKVSFKYYDFLMILKEVYGNSMIISYLDNLNQSSESNMKESKNILNFLSKLFLKIEVNFSETSIRDFQFFLIPPICLQLSENTRVRFLDTVDRESSYTKILSLLNETDYFMFEMFNNEKIMNEINRLFLFLLDFYMFYFELFNYFIIVLHQVFVFINYSQSNDVAVTFDEKNKLHNNNVFLAIFQISYLLIVFFIWFKTKFSNCFYRNVMTIYNKSFLYHSNPAFTMNLNKYLMTHDNLDYHLSSFISDLSYFHYAKVVFLDTVILNKELFYLILSLILSSLYLGFGNSIYLTFQVMFLVNLSIILNGIVVAVKMRYVQLISILVFTYLIVYVFSSIAFLYLYESMSFSDVLKIDDKESSTFLEKENFCESSLHCYLSHISYGIRSGGGIGDVLPKISFNDEKNYIGRTFYDIFFHICVVWIMGNIFFGIIVDTFADLRDKNSIRENDIKNVCYICHVDRDTCITRNIDFNYHVAHDHYVWNYVYFITYLHLNDPSYFKRLESQVWLKLLDKDTSWFPRKFAEKS